MSNAAWAQTARTALMPIAVGLILAGVATLAYSSLSSVSAFLIGGVAFALIWRTRVAAIAVVLGGMAVGSASSLLGF